MAHSICYLGMHVYTPLSGEGHFVVIVIGTPAPPVTLEVSLKALY